jgi:ribosome recycling factor
MIENYDDVMLRFQDNIEKRLSKLKYDFTAIRAGRVSVRMLDNILANYYGTLTPITQMANIMVPEARMIVISPWDISTVKEINKAILASDLGVTPTDDGRVIRLVFPSPTEDKRKELVRDVKKLAEEARISVRNERKDALEIFKSAEKDKKMTEDELSLATDEVQKTVDKYNGIIDNLAEQKEKEVMEV